MWPQLCFLFGYFLKHSVTNQQPCRPILLLWCTSPTPSPKRFHWSPGCMAAFHCVCLQLLQATTWLAGGSSHSPWRGSLFHVIIMNVTKVTSMSFCAHPRAKSWQFHSPVSPDPLSARSLHSLGFPKSPPLKILDPPFSYSTYSSRHFIDDLLRCDWLDRLG